MLSKRLVRRIDNRGRITFPIANLNSINLHTGDSVEIALQDDGVIVIRPYKKSWEDTVLKWWNENYDRPAMRRSNFTRMGDYTFCVLCKSDGTCMAGFAKRCFGDKDDDRIGRVAAFARAIGKPINELVGWKG